MNSPLTIYCLPGLGTDHRIFQNLTPKLKNANFVFLDFREDLMQKGDGIEGYAKRLAAELREDFERNNCALLGLSLGGFVAVELAKLLPHQALILISSLKQESERPWPLRLARRLPLHKLSSAWFSRNIVPLLSRIFAVTDKEGYYLYREMLKGWSAKMFRWARSAAVDWHNQEPPKRFLQIHGTRDHIFTHKRIEASHYIPRGTHYMIMDKADEIAQYLKQNLHL